MRRPALHLTLGVLLTLAAPARPDTVKLTGRPAFDHVIVSDFSRGRLVFRGVSGQILRKPLAQIEFIHLPGHPELFEAEQAAVAGNWTHALERYAAARATDPPAWLRRYILAREMRAADAAGAFDRAVEAYLELGIAGAADAGVSPPNRPGPPGSKVNERAVSLLQDAGTNPSLRPLLLQLLILENLPIDSRQWPPIQPAEPAASLPDARPPGRSESLERPVGLLPALATASAPAAAAATPVRLPADSFLLSFAAEWADRDPTRGQRWVEAALPYVPTQDRSPWRIVLARCRISVGAADAAASDLLALAASETDPAVVATALYYAGLAHERLGRGDVARGLYAEAAERPAAPPEIREKARTAAQRLETAR